MGDPKLVEIPTPEQLAELERLEREATPGKWHVTHHEGIGYRVWAEHPNPTPGYTTATIADGQWSEVDGDLIAAMRNALPSLLSAARRLGEVEAYCASLRERAESERGSAEHRLLVNADLQRQITTANARIAELEAEVKRASAEGAKAERAKVVVWLRDTSHPLLKPKDLADAIERGEHDDG